MARPEAERYLDEARRRLDDFYRALAQLGEVAPGPRFRLEGFMEAGLCLQLVERQALQALIDECYQTHMGQVPEPAEVEAEGVVLPVRWQRAPVYRA